MGLDAAASDAATAPIGTTGNFWTPPKNQGASNKKFISKDTTRPYPQTIYRWTAYCYTLKSKSLFGHI